MTVLETARRVLAQGPICDACLGRVLADRSFGLTNAERGRALRISLALEDDEPYDPPEDPCWVCNGRCREFEEWADRAIDELAGIEFETYQVGTRTTPLIEENERLLRADADLDPDAGEPFKSEFNREVGKRVGERLGVEVDFDRPDVVALLDLETERVDVQINPAFVYGRYEKLARGIPQTEWPCRDCNGSGYLDGEPCEHCDGQGYMYEESVEELVAPPVQDAMAGADATFHGAGREDVDARMLGTGRPFVVEVTNPRERTPDVDRLATAIDEHAGDAVAVTDLALATYEMVERVKELDASKRYRARIELSEPVEVEEIEAGLERLRGETIEQETPQRVSHRRADKTRTRDVYEVELSEVDDESAVREATIEIHGEGGLYIKELLHGDEGRTEPSLAGVLETDVEVTALDVLAVRAADGSFAEPEFLKTEEPGADE